MIVNIETLHISEERAEVGMREVDIDSKKKMCLVPAGIALVLFLHSFPGSSQRSSTGIALRILNPFILKTIIVKPVKLVGLFI